MRRRAPRVLTIAGSDSGGGAGIQADLKAIAAHGGYGMSVLTALTAQNTLGVRAVQVAPSSFVVAQIDAVFADLRPDAVKIGMLAEASVVEAVAERLRHWVGPPVVLDPVMIAASGDPLLRDDAVDAIRDRLMPLATIVTPNLPEAERLAGHVADSLSARRDLAAEIGALGAPAVLLKGGHAAGDEVVDLLWTAAGVEEIRHPRIETGAGHGTGCTLSSSIASRLARGESLAAACRGAVEWLAVALREAEPIGGGSWPVDPFWTVRLEGRFA